MCGAAGANEWKAVCTVYVSVGEDKAGHGERSPFTQKGTVSYGTGYKYRYCSSTVSSG